MKTLVASITMAFALIGLSAIGTAAEPEESTEPKSRSDVTPAIEGGTFRVEPIKIGPNDNQSYFQTGPAAQQAMDQMRERLKDPVQRVALRREQRQAIEQRHPDIEQALGVSAATKEKLFELLTDEQMEQLDDSMNRGQGYRLEVQAQADAETRRLTALRDLLGQAGLKEFKKYLATLSEREQVSKFDELLSVNDKLQREQKEKLIELFADQNQQRFAHLRARRSVAPMRTLPSAEERRRESQLATIELNEASLRALENSNPLMAKRAAEFLSPIQLEAFSRMNQERAAAQRRWIEQARLQAGLQPQIPEHPVALLAQPEDRTPLTGDIAFEFTVTVNRSSPVTITHTGPNAKPILVEAGDGLWVEATATLFEDHWFDVHLAYLERDASEKRRLDQQQTHFGALMRMPDGSASGGAIGTDMVVGDKGYAVHISVKLQAP
jgi:hypothetical protein